MHRLIILKNGDVVKGVMLENGEYIIGRDSKSDIHLNDPSISRNHARLVQVQDYFYIEDLGSTNGTRCNSMKLKRHLLKNEDMIQIGGFGLYYTNVQVSKKAINNTDANENLDAKTQPPMALQDQIRGSHNSNVATLRFFRGPNKGLLKTVSRSLYTIGQPGDEVAAIARRPQGFYLLNIGGDSHPKINDQEISTSAGIQLNDGDILEVGDHLLELYLDA